PTSQQKIKEMFEAEALSKEASHIDTSSPERIVHENTMHKSKEVDVAPECTHHFGYLKTLSKNAPVPIECLSCNRIIMCKHSLVTSLESPARS
ncbi:MAG: hypothetical protein JSV51_09120, partial [Candidatus Bathyarchaeota archaeon]